LICRKINIIPVEWDGMMKYYAPSEKLKQARQKLFADRLKNKIVIEKKVKNILDSLKVVEKETTTTEEEKETLIEEVKETSNLSEPTTEEEQSQKEETHKEEGEENAPKKRKNKKSNRL
jgi:hypothetical protein